MTKQAHKHAPKEERRLITHPDQIPDFDTMTEEEEAEFWETHDFADGVLEEGPEVDAEFERILYGKHK